MVSTTTTNLDESSAEKPPSAPKKFRVQIDFDASDFALINQLVADLELGTRAELFRSGLRVLRWMIRKKAEGSTVVAITPDQRFLEPEFEFLRHVAPAATRRAEPTAGDWRQKSAATATPSGEVAVHG